MASPLRLHVGRAFWLSRGGALAGIVVLHLGALALALSLRGPRPDPVSEHPIQVVMFTESRTEPVPPQQQVTLVEPELVSPVMPLVNIEIPPMPAAITVASVPAPSPPPPAPVMAVRATDPGDEPVVVTRVDYLRQPSIAYPPAAKRARAQGTVEVNVLVDTEGRPREARVHRSSGFAALDKAAVDSVLAALFRPYVQNGVPRSMRVIVPINFSLTTRAVARRTAERGPSELDVGGEDHHALRGHAEEFRRLGTASLHPREETELQVR